MNRNLALVFLLSGSVGSAYADDAFDKVVTQTNKIEKRIDVLDRNAKQTLGGIAALKKQTIEVNTVINLQQEKLKELSIKIEALEGKQSVSENKQTTLDGSLQQLSRSTQQKAQTIDATMTSWSLWYGGAILFLLCLLGASYWYLRRRNDAGEQTLAAQVKKTMDTVRSTDEKIAKSDTALADSLFEILSKLKVQDIPGATSKPSAPAEPDHNLPLKLADEIHRMRKRLASLPEDTKGLMPLQKSLERLESELTEQGYEIVDHTGMGYSENLSVKARFVPSDELASDQKIITKVVTPQINYNGVMIRMADIEVSIGS